MMRKVAISSLFLNQNTCLGAQKNCLCETILLSTHNICFGRGISKILVNFVVLTDGMRYVRLLCSLCISFIIHFCARKCFLNS